MVDPIAEAGALKVTPATRGPQRITANHGATFLVAGADGAISRDEDGWGLFHSDTRFISRYQIELDGVPLRPLSYSQPAHWRARWELMGAARGEVAPGEQPPATVTVTVDRTLGPGRMHEEITVRQWGGTRAHLLLTIALESDFADLFEVRTRRWQRRGPISTTWDYRRGLETVYRRDDFVRRHRIRFRPWVPGTGYANGALRFPIDVEAGKEWRLCLQHDLIDHAGARPALQPCPTDGQAATRLQSTRQRRWLARAPRLRCSDRRLTEAYWRSLQDFSSLRLHEFDLGADLWMPAAGLPWFAALFGRDSLLAAHQALMVDHRLALTTLRRLGELQATVEDPFRDAQPGKIPHELRRGEWARFGIVPHSPYYGTADATSLFLLLLGSLWRWHGDAAVLRPLEGVARRCLDWVDRYGDLDGDGLQEYRRQLETNYRNQGWRDAEDGILDELGDPPPLPIGTCEMQAYVFAGKRGCAGLFEAWGDAVTAARLKQEAEELRDRFRQAFRDPATGQLALALDGSKRRVMSATSNPGHCLWAGIVAEEDVGAVTNRLMQPDLCCGWGLRTLSSDHPAFDPHSYQRGSVWPHDTVIAADGMIRHGHLEEGWRLLDGVLAAAAAFEGFQLPELFSGLVRSEGDVPVPYPQANRPQAWASGSVFHAIRAILGLHPDLPSGRIYLNPRLPPWCPEISVAEIRLGSGRLAVEAHRRRDGSTEMAASLSGVGAEVIQADAPWLGE